MKHKVMSVDAMPSSSLKSWLGQELETRGIDAVIYTRYILSILQQDHYEVDPAELDPFESEVKVATKVKRARKAAKGSGTPDSDKLKKNAAVECLLAVTDEVSGIEMLVDELYQKLKQQAVTKVVLPEIQRLQRVDSSNDSTSDDTDRDESADSSPTPTPDCNGKAPSSGSTSQKCQGRLWSNLVVEERTNTRGPTSEKVSQKPEPSPKDTKPQGDPSTKDIKAGKENGRKISRTAGGDGTPPQRLGAGTPPAPRARGAAGTLPVPRTRVAAGTPPAPRRRGNRKSRESCKGGRSSDRGDSRRQEVRPRWVHRGQPEFVVPKVSATYESPIPIRTRTHEPPKYTGKFQIIHLTEEENSNGSPERDVIESRSQCLSDDSNKKHVAASSQRILSKSFPPERMAVRPSNAALDDIDLDILFKMDSPRKDEVKNLRIRDVDPLTKSSRFLKLFSQEDDLPQGVTPDSDPQVDVDFDVTPTENIFTLLISETLSDAAGKTMQCADAICVANTPVGKSSRLMKMFSIDKTTDSVDLVGDSDSATLEETEVFCDSDPGKRSASPACDLQVDGFLSGEASPVFDFLSQEEVPGWSLCGITEEEAATLRELFLVPCLDDQGPDTVSGGMQTVNPASAYCETGEPLGDVPTSRMMRLFTQSPSTETDLAAAETYANPDVTALNIWSLTDEDEGAKRVWNADAAREAVSNDDSVDRMTSIWPGDIEAGVDDRLETRAQNVKLVGQSSDVIGSLADVCEIRPGTLPLYTLSGVKAPTDSCESDTLLPSPRRNASGLGRASQLSNSLGTDNPRSSAGRSGGGKGIFSQYLDDLYGQHAGMYCFQFSDWLEKYKVDSPCCYENDLGIHDLPEKIKLLPTNDISFQPSSLKGWDLQGMTSDLTLVQGLASVLEPACDANGNSKHVVNSNWPRFDGTSYHLPPAGVNYVCGNDLDTDRHSVGNCTELDRDLFRVRRTIPHVQSDSQLLTPYSLETRINFRHDYEASGFQEVTKVSNAGRANLQDQPTGFLCSPLTPPPAPPLVPRTPPPAPPPAVLSEPDTNEDLLFSPKTHFRPIQIPPVVEAKTSANATPDVSFEPPPVEETLVSSVDSNYQQYVHKNKPPASPEFIPKFKIQRDLNKSAQTDDLSHDRPSMTKFTTQRLEDILEVADDSLFGGGGDQTQIKGQPSIPNAWVNVDRDSKPDIWSSTEVTNPGQIWNPGAELTITRSPLESDLHPESWSVEDESSPMLRGSKISQEFDALPEGCSILRAEILPGVVNISGDFAANTAVQVDDVFLDDEIEFQAQMFPYETAPPMPKHEDVIYSSDLEEQWRQSETTFKVQVPKRDRPQDCSQRKPCSFFMEGLCRRSDCKYSHDLSRITCRFWEAGNCFKGITCPFLHGYATGNETTDAVDKLFKLEVDADFPELFAKADTSHKKSSQTDSHSENKTYRRRDFIDNSHSSTKPIDIKSTKR